MNLADYFQVASAGTIFGFLAGTVLSILGMIIAQIVGLIRKI